MVSEFPGELFMSSGFASPVPLQIALGVLHVPVPLAEKETAKPYRSGPSQPNQKRTLELCWGGLFFLVELKGSLAEHFPAFHTELRHGGVQGLSSALLEARGGAN